MRTVRRVHKRWRLFLGYIFIVVAIGLIDFSETQTLESWAQVGVCAGGFLVCICGFFLIWNARGESAVSARGVPSNIGGIFWVDFGSIATLSRRTNRMDCMGTGSYT